jgi:sugar fermentation stimulation protein A
LKIYIIGEIINPVDLQKYEKAIFSRRINRFIIECSLGDKRIRAYLPNPGRLLEILLPGRQIYLLRNPSHIGRATDYTVIAALKDGIPILLDTHHANNITQMLITEGKIPGFKGYSIVRQEFKTGNSRFDFLLRRDKKDLVLEVKSCTLFGKEIAMFPDAVTLRGRRHLIELSKLSDRGMHCGVLFIVHSPFVRYFMPAYHVDLEFSQTLYELRNKLEIRAIAIKWNKDPSLGAIVHELEIPWELIKREAHDSGSYIIVLNLKNNHKSDIKSLGKVLFKEGYYLYVGSAKKNLTKRIQRHMRQRKKLYWHIDYLREEADFYSALPIRASSPLECKIAQSLKRISDWVIPGFGASDCDCETHLFGMNKDPFQSPQFIKMLQYFRIDRLKDELSLL